MCPGWSVSGVLAESSSNPFDPSPFILVIAPLEQTCRRSTVAFPARRVPGVAQVWVQMQWIPPFGEDCPLFFVSISTRPPRYDFRAPPWGALRRARRLPVFSSRSFVLSSWPFVLPGPLAGEGVFFMSVLGRAAFFLQRSGVRIFY